MDGVYRLSTGLVASRPLMGFVTTMNDLNLLFANGRGELAEAKVPFHIRQKCHQLQHMVDLGIPLWGNPRNFWCFRDEAFVGAMKRLAAACKHPATLESVCMAKARLFAALEAVFPED